jgi:hypothetical protein
MNKREMSAALRSVPIGATRLLMVATALLATLGLFAPKADAVEFGFAPGTSSVTVSDTQAGAHADMTTNFDLMTGPDNLPGGNLRDVRVSLPQGFWGTPPLFAQCNQFQLTNLNLCPKDAQVGEIHALLLNAFGPTVWDAPLYNMYHGPGEAAQFGANFIAAQALIKVKVRPTDYGLDAVTLSLPTAITTLGASVTLWGVPADHLGGGLSRRPFMTNPSICDGPGVAEFAMDPWEDASNVVTDTATVPAFTGCDRLPALEPSLSAGPEGAAAGEPAGYQFDLRVPQTDDPDSITPPTVKEVTVALPEGVAISPAAADGLKACTDEQLSAGSSADPSCPDGSKVGSVSIETPSLPDPLQGALYLGQPLQGRPYRLFLVAEGPGVTIKLRGVAQVNPDTGQITTIFRDTPALPFSELHVRLKGGERALLANPRSCGTKTVTATLTPYGDRPAEVATSDFTISGSGEGGACTSTPFRPSVDAGVLDPTAGGSSPFVLRVQRSGLEAELKTISSALPPGLLARVGDVPLCTGGQAAAGACPAASRIGTVVAGAGPGSNPFYVDTGRVFLTEGYKGAPFGLDFLVPAIAGPYDLGDVNVRAALLVDPVTAEVTVDADPMPWILQGIPLQVRDVRVLMDRPGFMQSPTSCREMSVGTTLTSYVGDSVTVPNRFQLGDCDALGFRPKLSLKLSGPTHRSAHPKLRAVLKAREGDANIGKAVVTLPKTEFLENAHIQTICTRVRYAADNCPARSVYGYAKAWSPLLDQPLQGPVYLRSSNHQLPDLVASLDGQIHVDLAGRIDSVNERIRNTFWAVPDAPVSKFVLTMQGGKKGLLVNNTELCGANPRASVQFTGQNGKVSSSNPLVKTDCEKSK